MCCFWRIMENKGGVYLAGLHKASRWMRLFMILFILLLLSTVTFYFAKSQYQLVIARQRETLGMVNKHLELNLNVQLLALQFLAADPEIRSLNPDEVYNELSHSREVVNFSNINVFDRQGRIISQVRETCPNPNYDMEKFDAVLSGKRIITDVIHCTSYQPYVNLSVPVYNEKGYVQGVISSEVLLTEIGNLIGDHKLSFNQTIFIKDGNNGKVYASGFLSELMPPDEEFDQISDREKAEPIYNQDKIYLYMPVDNTKWQVILVTPVSEVYKTVFKESLPELTILCLMALCAGLLYRNFLHKKLFEENIRRFRMERLISVNQLAASLAHEIRNPLTSIKGFIQLMNRGEGERVPNQEHIKIILTEIDRIDKLTNEFQQLTRPLKTPHFVKVNIEQMIHDVILLMENQAVVKKITLTFFNKMNLLSHKYIGIMEGTLVNRSSYILGDEAQLKQVLINLVKNAIDAVGRNGEVKILLSRKEDFIVMEVKDNGIGMSKEILKKIGTPFYTTKEGGNGLGLSVCYNIIEGHSGSIKVQSEFGQGTIFSIKLPCAE
ncbi:histidine kinase [Pelosinus sp. UFO1]|nr:histidine kinase [Pelosinus sp. UFO1]